METQDADQRTSIEDVEHLCESTIELIKSINQELAAARMRAETASASAGTCSTKASETVIEQTKQPLLNCTTSNASNRHPEPSSTSVTSGDNIVVLTSPSEIPITLHLESWLGSDGRLVVKPSLFLDDQEDRNREQERPQEGLVFGTTGASNSSRLPREPAQQEQLVNQQLQARGCNGCCFCEGASGCGANVEGNVQDGCCDNGELQAPAQRPQQMPKPRRQNRVFLAATTSGGVRNGSNGAAANTIANAGHSQPTRRSLRLVPATTARPSSVVGAGSGEETQLLIKKLHRLLSLELKRSASRSRAE